MYIYVNYFPKWAQRFQEIILNEEVVKNNETEVKKEENNKRSQENKEENQKVYDQKVEKEVEKILGINKKEKEEISIIDKIKNYIKMLKSKISQE